MSGLVHRSALVVCAATLLACGGQAPEEPSIEIVTFSSDSQTRRSDHFPNIALQTQHGDEVRFRDLIHDRIVVVNFMYTSCTGI